MVWGDPHFGLLDLRWASKGFSLVVSTIRSCQGGEVFGCVSGGDTTWDPKNYVSFDSEYHGNFVVGPSGIWMLELSNSEPALDGSIVCLGCTSQEPWHFEGKMNLWPGETHPCVSWFPVFYLKDRQTGAEGFLWRAIPTIFHRTLKGLMDA